MTVAQLIECLLGKVAAIKGMEADGTSFNEIDVESIKDSLEKSSQNINDKLFIRYVNTIIKLPNYKLRRLGYTYYEYTKLFTKIIENRKPNLINSKTFDEITS